MQRLDAMAIESVWTVDKAEDFDLYGFARSVFQQAIDNLKQDGDLVSTAFVVDERKLHCFAVPFTDHDEKGGVYKELIDFAKQQNGQAIVTINDAYWGPPEAAEEYYPGKLGKEYGWECIHVTVSGPGLRNWSIEVKYRRHGDELEFADCEEGFGGTIGFLDGWADEVKSVN